MMSTDPSIRELFDLTDKAAPDAMRVAQKCYPPPS